MAMQPMTWRGREDDPGLTIVFNGAIYNHRELRRDLEAHGAQFRTLSDTEVLLAAWDQWGQEALGRFEGMFAFALHDARAHALYVARDRFGEKPLHWAHVVHAGRSGLAFASDVRQLLPFCAGGARLNTQVMADFLNAGVCDRNEQTFFEGVARVPAGAFARIDLSALPVCAPEFRDWRARPQMRTHTPDALRAALTRSVDLRLSADAPVGACLSGGLDSSFILALAARTGASLHTVTALYDEPGLSELAYWREAVTAFAPQAHTIEPSAAQALEALPAVVAAQGEPFANTSVITQWLVFQAARAAGLKVMLDGQGADELFVGYAGMAAFHLADLLGRGRIGAWRDLINALQAGDSDFSALALRRQSLRLVAPRWRGGRIDESWLSPSLPYVETPLLDGGSRLSGLIHRLVYATSLPALLRYEDRNAMDHGVETRLPFLAPEVADTALTMPESLLLKGGWTKAILRDAASGLVPEKIVRRRRKLGFATPQDTWLQTGAWRDWAAERMEDGAAILAAVLDGERVNLLRAKFGAGHSVDGRVFRLAIAAAWAQAFSVRCP